MNYIDEETGYDRQPFRASTLLVAIDVSKYRHEVLMGIPGKKRRRQLTITNSLADFQRLASNLASYDLPVRAGFEATGNYNRTLAHYLGQSGFGRKLVSSVGLARTREALHYNWDKNDPKDAQVMLLMLEISCLCLILHHMRQRRLCYVARCIGLFLRPRFEGSAEHMHVHVIAQPLRQFE